MTRMNELSLFDVFLNSVWNWMHFFLTLYFFKHLDFIFLQRWVFGSSNIVLAGCTLHSQWKVFCSSFTSQCLRDGWRLPLFLKRGTSHLVSISPNIVCALAACNELTFIADFMSTSRRRKTELKLNLCVYLLRFCVNSQLCVYNLSVPLDQSVFL
jgi:hypothetical protein